MGKIKEKEIELIDISGGTNLIYEKYKEGYNKGFVHGIWTCSFIVLVAIAMLLIKLAMV